MRTARRNSDRSSTVDACDVRHVGGRTREELSQLECIGCGAIVYWVPPCRLATVKKREAHFGSRFHTEDCKVPGDAAAAGTSKGPSHPAVLSKLVGKTSRLRPTNFGAMLKGGAQLNKQTGNSGLVRPSANSESVSFWEIVALLAQGDAESVSTSRFTVGDEDGAAGAGLIELAMPPDAFVGGTRLFWGRVHEARFNAANNLVWIQWSENTAHFIRVGTAVHLDKWLRKARLASISEIVG
jgi:hypothetical protein